MVNSYCYGRFPEGTPSSTPLVESKTINHKLQQLLNSWREDHAVQSHISQCLSPPKLDFAPSHFS